jgi:hypothetical protein
MVIKVVEGEGIEKVLEEEKNVDTIEDDDGDEQHKIIEDNDEDDAGLDLNLLDQMYLLECVNGTETDLDYKELKSANGVPHYNAAEMVTGVKVERFMRLGEVLTTRKSDQQRIRRREELESGLRTRTNVLLTAIHILKDERYDTFGIQDGKDQNVEAFKAARGYDVPSMYKDLQRGWARRCRRGEMYGRKYIDKFKALLYTWFKEGSKDKEMKVGPSIMADRLREKYPGIYTLPDFSEIQSFISKCFQNEKKNKSEERMSDDESDEDIPEEESGDDADESDKESTDKSDDNDKSDEEVSNKEIADESHDDDKSDEETLGEESDNNDVCYRKTDLIEEAITLVDYHGGEIQPQYVRWHLLIRFGERVVDRHWNNVKPAIGKRRDALAKQRKHILIG